MNDSLTKAVAQALQQQEQERNSCVDPRWDALAASQLGTEEQQRLLADTPPEQRETLLALFAPMPAEDKQSLVDRLSRKQAAEAKPSRVWDRLLDAVRWLFTPPPLRWSAVLVPVATAVVLMVWQRDDQPPPLPSYSLEARGGQAQWRSDPVAPTAGALSVPADGMLDLTLRPDERHAMPVEVHAFLHKERTVQPWPLTFQRSASGAFNVRVPVKEMVARTQGSADVVLVLVPREVKPDNLLQYHTPQEMEEAGRKQGFQVLHQFIHVVAGP